MTACYLGTLGITILFIMAAFACQLFQVRDGSWCECQESVRMEVSPMGMLFRINKSHQLLIDFPRQAMEMILEIKPQEFYMVSCQDGNKLAVKFPDEKLAKSFVSNISRWGFQYTPFSERGGTAQDILDFPDLSDKNVQELVLQLMLSEDFHEFTRELEKVLNKWSDKVGLRG